MKKTVVVVLAFLICLAVSSCFLRKVVSGVSRISGVSYVDSAKYSVGNFTYRASDVDTVSVNYISGKLTIVQSASKTLEATETSSEKLSDAQTMHWYLDGSTLRIRFCESGFNGTIPDKALVLEIPEGIDIELDLTSGEVVFDTEVHAENVEIGTTSGTVRVGKLTAVSFEAGSTSGDTYIDSVSADDVKLASTSGSTEIGRLSAGNVDFAATSGSMKIGSASCDSMDGASTSGNITIGLDRCSKLRIGCTSGNVELSRLPAGGATVDYDKTSGTLKADGYMIKGGKMVFGNGECSVSVTTTSGNLTVR